MRCAHALCCVEEYGGIGRKFSEWGSFEPMADEWVVRETDDAVYEKLLCWGSFAPTITQMKEHLRSLVLYHTAWRVV